MGQCRSYVGRYGLKKFKVVKMQYAAAEIV